MASHNSDDNLLFGILAMQNGFIGREQLVAAVSTWLQDKTRPLAEILRDVDALGDDEQALLAALVDRHVARHDHDAEKSLSVVGTIDSSLRRELLQLGDAGLEASLSHCPLTNEQEVYETTQAYSAERGERFRILRPHAEGGLGIVSVALDGELHREVALKEIRKEHAEKLESRARFVQEAEVTGGLEHPGIVPVYGLGEYDDGRPFYVMRFIRGDNLKVAADRFHRAGNITRQSFESVDFRNLLGRFIDVCNAVEYAHSRGVLHRDLKPGNIMVGKYGETLVVDWGLAKPMGNSGETPSEEPSLRPPSGSGVVETLMGTTVGTPAFMSPEQAEGRLDQLQPASDVYSLGATLYYLLTGQPPFRAERVSEILAAVRNGEFPLPRQIQPATPPALEAICRKAMSKDRKARYQRASELAAELELWLADEPVDAFTEPLTVRLARAVRKHRTKVAGILAVLVTAIVAMAVTSVVVAAKNSALKVARDESEANRKQAVQAKELAERNLTTARAIALNILEIAEQNLSNVPGKEGFRETMMDRCYAMFADVYEQSPEDSSIAAEFAKVARMSGNVKRLVGKYDEARNRLRQSIRLQTVLLEGAAADVSYRDYLAETYRDLGTLESAAENVEAADAALAQAAEMITELIDQSPEDQDLRRTLGTIDLELVSLRVDLLEIERALSSATRCVRTYRELVESPNARPLDGVVMMLATARQGALLDRLGRSEEATDVLEEGIRVGRALVNSNPDGNHRYAFGRLLLSLLETTAAGESPSPDALTRMEETIELFSNLVESFPQHGGYRYYLGDSWRVCGLLRWHLGHSAEARQAFEQACSVLEQLTADVVRASYHDKLAQTYADRARYLMSGPNDRAEAKAWLIKAVEIGRRASESVPGNRDIRQRLQTYEAALAEF